MQVAIFVIDGMHYRDNGKDDRGHLSLAPNLGR